MCSLYSEYKNTKEHLCTLHNRGESYAFTVKIKKYQFLIFE